MKKSRKKRLIITISILAFALILCTTLLCVFWKTTYKTDGYYKFAAAGEHVGFEVVEELEEGNIYKLKNDKNNSSEFKVEKFLGKYKLTITNIYSDVNTRITFNVKFVEKHKEFSIFEFQDLDNDYRYYAVETKGNKVVGFFVDSSLQGARQEIESYRNSGKQFVEYFESNIIDMFS